MLNYLSQTLKEPFIVMTWVVFPHFQGTGLERKETSLFTWNLLKAQVWPVFERALPLMMLLFSLPVCTIVKTSFFNLLYAYGIFVSREFIENVNI